MKPKELHRPRNKSPKYDREQVRLNAQARRRLEEVRDEEHDEEIDAVIHGRNLDGPDNL